MFNAQIYRLSSTFDLVIALNKRSRFDYHVDQRYEVGIAPQGWELNALRA
jgi:tmRNA-binding protein